MNIKGDVFLVFAQSQHLTFSSTKFFIVFFRFKTLKSRSIMKICTLLDPLRFSSTNL